MVLDRKFDLNKEIFSWLSLEKLTRIESRRNRYAVRGQHEVSDSTVKTVKYRFAYTDYEHNEIEEGMVATRFERDTFEFRSDFTHNPIANFEGLFGFQFVFDDTNIGGSEGGLRQIFERKGFQREDQQIIRQRHA